MAALAVVKGLKEKRCGAKSDQARYHNFTCLSPSNNYQWTKETWLECRGKISQLYIMIVSFNVDLWVEHMTKGLFITATLVFLLVNCLGNCFNKRVRVAFGNVIRGVVKNWYFTFRLTVRGWGQPHRPWPRANMKILTHLKGLKTVFLNQKIPVFLHTPKKSRRLKTMAKLLSEGTP